MGGGGSRQKDIEKRPEAAIPEMNTEEMMKLIDFDSSSIVDSFAKEMFLRSPKVEGLNHVLTSQHGREAFMKFLRTE